MSTFLDREKAFLSSVGVGKDASALLSHRIGELEALLAEQQSRRAIHNRSVHSAMDLKITLSRIISLLGEDRKDWAAERAFSSPLEIASSLCSAHTRLLSAAFFSYAASQNNEGPIASKDITLPLARAHNQNIMAALIHAGTCLQIDAAVRSVMAAAGLSNADFSRRGNAGEGSARLNLEALDVLFGEFPFPGHVDDGIDQGRAFLAPCLFTMESQDQGLSGSLFGTLLAGAASYINGKQLRESTLGSKPVHSRYSDYRDILKKVPLFSLCLRHVEESISYVDSRDTIGRLDGNYYPFPSTKALRLFEERVNDFVSTAIYKSADPAQPSPFKDLEGSAWSRKLPFVNSSLAVPSL